MRPTSFFNRLWPLLFGYDFFVSYRRADAAAYAESLVEALQERGFVCFLDREETVGGVALAPALERALKRSRALIAILTPGVLDSPWVIGARQIQDRFDAIGRRQLALVGSPTIESVRRIANHPFLRGLADAKDKMDRYHRIEDGDRLRFLLVGNPGVATRADYVDFIRALGTMEGLVRD